MFSASSPPITRRASAARTAGVAHLVADEEQVAPLAALVETVDRGAPGHEVGGQLVALGHLPSAVALEEDVAELDVHAVVAFELAHLQRHAVGHGVADRPEHDLRVRDVPLALQQPEQLRQLLLQAARDVSH
jgi:hypothetical protein